jgi:hypothetical protein
MWVLTYLMLWGIPLTLPVSILGPLLANFEQAGGLQVGVLVGLLILNWGCIGLIVHRMAKIVARK